MANPRQNDRGGRESDLVMADAQAIPLDGAADNSEHCVDFALVAPRIEAGMAIKLKVMATTTFGISAATPTLTIGIITDTTEPTGASWSSAATVAPGVLIIPVASAVAGEIFEAYLPSIPAVPYERFVGFSMTPSTSGFSAGNLDVWLDIA